MSERKNADQRELLYARLDDLCAVAEKGEVGISQFLTPAEAYFSELYLKRRRVSYILFGGCPAAERCRVYLLPDYMDELLTNRSDLSDGLAEYGYSLGISVLEIKGSGYKKFTHRDILGSVLSLGLERSVIGDIYVSDREESSAIVFCDSAISVFLEQELSRVSNDKVRVKILEKGEWEIPERRMQPIHDTVASPRLDAVVAALCNLSREKASETVTSGLVELDFESEERPDRSVSASSVISVRGIGRFRVVSLGDKTRKGRYRLEAEKYV